MVTPQSPLSSAYDFDGSAHIALLSVNHFVLFTNRLALFLNLPMHFWDLNPSVNSKDLASDWPEEPALKNKCMNWHLSYNQGEVLLQSKIHQDADKFI